ncbi:transposase IS1016, partial [Neisseria meningitidis LNP27256]
FFFQAEDGIRDLIVTGVQTCALPISSLKLRFRINHSTHFAERQNHINGIENFWNQAKRHLRKFNGIPKAHFELYLKECERRFNNSEIKVLVPF